MKWNETVMKSEFGLVWFGLAEPQLLRNLSKLKPLIILDNSLRKELRVHG